jgi:hypothetical protein
MKIIISFVFLFSSIIVFAQDQESLMLEFAADKIASFSASDGAEKVDLSTGGTRIERNYSYGNKTMEMKLNRSDDAARAESDSQQIMDMMKQMEDGNMITGKWIDQNGMKGYIGYMANANQALIAISFGGNYLLDISIKGASGLDDAESVFEKLDFSKF